MIFETIIVLEIIAQIIGVILGIIQPIVTPIGELMVLWVNYLLQYFPYGNLTLYIAIFIILVVAGVIINASIIGRILKEKVEEFEDKLAGDEEEEEDIEEDGEIKNLKEKDESVIYAFSDSIWDFPLFSAADYKIAVNPDRKLKKIAKKNLWQVI